MALKETPDRKTIAAINASFLATIPQVLLDKLLLDAVRLDIPAGTIPYRESEKPRAALVISGLARIYLTSPEGRQVTIRYARSGEMLGMHTMVRGPSPVNLQTITDCSFLLFNIKTLEKLCKTHPGIGWSIAEEISRCLMDLLEEVAGNVFGSVRERTARHLLDLAAQSQNKQKLIARVTQQEVADAVGSVREVIARTLRKFQTEHLVKSSPQGIVILDPAGLRAVARRESR
jgi:CRP/FNR family transcriptional regulator, cyclic AMP receptor protein